MTIEFLSPSGTVKNSVIHFIKERLMELHHLDKEIVRAQVYLRELTGEFDERHNCEIDITVYGDSVYVSRNGKTYLQAARKVLNELEQRVKEQVNNQQELPDEITSTIKV